jgi:HEAT repeat protein
LEILKEGDANSRRLAVSALAQIEPEAKTVLPGLLPALKDSDPQICLGAAKLVVALAPGNREGLAVLGALTRRNLALIYTGAIESLSSLRHPPASVVQGLGDLLGDPVPRKGLAAANALAAMGPAAEAARPALAAATRARDASLRLAAARALSVQRSNPDNAIPVLVEALTGFDVTARKQAAEALGAFGPLAKPAVGVLENALCDSEIPVAAAAAEVLLKVDAAAAQAAVPLLLDRARRHDRSVSISSALAAARISPGNERAIGVLKEALRSSNASVQHQAARALAQLGPEAKDAATALRDCLSDCGESVRIAASLALWKVAGDTDTAIANLVDVITQSTASASRQEAVRALGEMGPPAKPAVHVLVDLLNDRTATFRRDALDALKKIDPKEATRVTSR